MRLSYNMFVSSGRLSMDFKQTYKCNKTIINDLAGFRCTSCTYLSDCWKIIHNNHYIGGCIFVPFSTLFLLGGGSNNLKWASMNLQSDNITNRFLAKLIIDEEIEL